MLESFINDSKVEHLKKADLISYWIENFSMYIQAEETFTPQRLLRYSRGNVIRVNFGFNIGKEFGGLHYAVVVDNDNKRNADVLTVIPLSSTDGKTVHNSNVDLGSELYSKIASVHKSLILNAQAELDELQRMQDSFTATFDIILSLAPSLTPADIDNKISELKKHSEEIAAKREHIEKSVSILQRNEQEILKLKRGSMALVNQITTVSKQRIYTPKRAEDFLYGISLSTSAMDKINDKIKELYVYE